MFSASKDRNQKPFQLIKQDDRFFSRLLSKENSMSSPSFRVYYGSLPGSVPFTWETRPGTPKHAHYDDSLPPLTPPPSYYTNSGKYSIPCGKKPSRSNLLRVLFLKISTLIKLSSDGHSSRSLGSSSLSSLSSSSTSSVFVTLTPKGRQLSSQGHQRSMSSYDSSSYNEGEDAGSSPTSTLCFGNQKQRSLSVCSCHRR